MQFDKIENNVVFVEVTLSVDEEGDTIDCTDKLVAVMSLTSQQRTFDIFFKQWIIFIFVDTTLLRDDLARRPQRTKLGRAPNLSLSNKLFSYFGFVRSVRVCTYVNVHDHIQGNHNERCSYILA